MIWVSDNTATDHLIGRLGREQVEAAMAAMGHGDPALNTPLLTTREFHTLVMNPELKARYQAADVDAKRALLAEEIAALPAPTIATAAFTAEASAGVGWLASANDLCRGMAALLALFDAPGMEPLGAIVALDTVAVPAVALDTETWPYIGFKGGRHEGMRSLTWLLQRADGGWFVVAGAFGDPARSLDNGAINQAMTAAADYVAVSR
jgi:beta-lactamase class A